MRWYPRDTANRSGSPFCALLVYLLATSWLPGQENIQFRDVGLESGLQLRHQCLGEAPLLPRLMVAGMAMFDYDSDGWLDIYLLNQGTLPLESLDQQDKAPLTEKKPAAFAPIGNRLYRNNRDGTYSDVTMLAGVASGQFCLGVVAADMDNDGDSDLLLNNFGSVEFYQNNGDGTFESATKGAMIEGPAGQFGAGIACLDIDHDGTLDIYASNYVDFTMERYRDRAEKSFPYPPGPKDFTPSPDRLLRNLGNGTFEDVSVSSGVAGFPGPTMGVICGDFDGDGDCDIFLCSDAAPNQLLVNDGRGKFTDQAVASGVVFDVSGNVNGSMGVDAGDYDNDGKIDLLITNYTGQTPVLYRNLGEGLFEDVSRRTQIGRTLLSATNWGVGLVDFDNDRDLDAFIANGHFLENIEAIDDRTSYRLPNTIMKNDGRGRFTDISKQAGAGMQVSESSRGAAFGDLDRDGDLDCVVLNAGAFPSLLENRTEALGHWIDIQLIGRQCNREGVGATVRVRSENKWQMAMVFAGRGYQSHYGTTLHFGLGKAKQIDSIEVTWPGGTVESYPADAVDRTYRLIQGRGIKP